MQTLVIDGVTITPNPVIAGRSILIEVSISEIPEGIVSADGVFILAGSGAYLTAQNTYHGVDALQDQAGNCLLAADGSVLEWS